MKDLAGQRFGRLTALEPTDKRVDQLVVWRCRCDCGRECEVPSSSLIKGNTRSCGCLHDEVTRRDLAGQRFGRLTAIRPVGRRNDYVVWECRCDCGNVKDVPTNQLTSGHTRSCGCLRDGAVRNDLAGRRFGRLTAVRPVGRKHRCVLWECRCDCGNVKEVPSSYLRSGKTRSCGCLARSAAPSQPREDLAGQRFGRLVVKRRVPEGDAAPERGGRSGGPLWECACDCGNTCEATSHALKTGNTRSCGCLASEAHRADLAGKRFGKLVAVEPTDRRVRGLVVWRCLCDCGRVCERTTAQLRTAKHPSCSQCG